MIVATHSCAWTSPGGVAGCVLEAGDKGLIEQRLKKKDGCISDAMGDDRGRGRERTNPTPLYSKQSIINSTTVSA